MKILYRSKTNRKIAGVCGGIGEYFGIDPTIVRIIWLSAILLAGTGILIYIIAWLVMPEGPNEIVISSHKPFRRSSKHRIIAGVCGGLGEYFELDPVIFRLGFVFLAITSFGWGILIYIILWIAVPLQKSS